MILDVLSGGGFNSFPKLPPEIRIQIWSLAIMEPRYVRIHAQKSGPRTDWLCSTRAPAIMHVCHDARAHAPYTKAFVTEDPHGDVRYAWVNFDVDMVVMQTVGEDGPDEDPLAWLASNKTSTPRVQRFRFEARYPCEENIDDFVRYLGRKLRMFLSLRELQIVVPNGMADWYAKAASDVTDLSCSWCGPCEPEDVSFVDRATGLLMTVGEARLLDHWDLSNGGRVREEEVEDYDWYAEDYGDSWVEQRKSDTETVAKTLGISQNLLDRIRAMKVIGNLNPELRMHDIADAAAFPALSIAAAVQSMKRFIAKADDIEREEREQAMLDFIGGILFAIPLLGEIVPASMGAIRGAILFVEGLGNTAMGEYDIVQDPGTGLMGAMLSLIGGEPGDGGFKRLPRRREG